jgi:putative DNA primase/helicase
MIQLGMNNIPRSKIKAAIAALVEKEQFDPFLDWMESVTWDGTSRIGLLADTLVQPALASDPDLKLLMLRTWLIQAVALSASPEPIQGRGVLVLAGPQYIGKTRWVEALCTLPGMVGTGYDLDPHDRDSIAKCTGVKICELAELAQTTRRDADAIKAFLSSPYDVVRLPYAGEHSRFRRRTAFTGTVNGDDFLRDDTGNTRFWTIKVERIQPNTLDMQQLWAEVHELWKAGAPHYMDMAAMQRVMAASEQHEQVSEPHERILQAYLWPAREERETCELTGWSRKTASEIADDINGPGRPTISAVAVGRAMGKIIKRRPQRTLERRDYYVPPLRKAVDRRGIDGQDFPDT